MLPLIAATALGAAEADAPLASDWSAPSRWSFQSEVHLPLPMWFQADDNRQARVLAWQLELVMSCAPGTPLGRRAVEVACEIDDAALIAAAYEPDRGMLDPILAEMEGKLERATVQLQVREDGRVTNIDLDGLPREHVRMARITEALRLIVSRAVAGLDQPLPEADEAQWAQYSGYLMLVPSDRGSSAGMEIVHARGPARPDGLATVQTVGRGTSWLWNDVANASNSWSMQLGASAAFGLDGELASRRWTIIGEPTPGSTSASGFSGLPYLQRGGLVRLTGPAPTLGASREAEMPGVDTSSGLPTWSVLGPVPGSHGPQVRP